MQNLSTARAVFTDGKARARDNKTNSVFRIISSNNKLLVGTEPTREQCFDCHKRRMDTDKSQNVRRRDLYGSIAGTAITTNHQSADHRIPEYSNKVFRSLQEVGTTLENSACKAVVPR